MRIHSYGFWVSNVVQVSIRKTWCWRLYISGSITTTETRFAPLVARLLPLDTVKTELEYLLPFQRYSTRKTTIWRDVSLFLLFFLSAKSLFTYLLLQEWSDPGNFDIILKLGIGRREFSILAGKFQLVDSPWGKQVPHYKHRRRSITYLLREIPVKNRERWDRSQQTGKLSG